MTAENKNHWRDIDEIILDRLQEQSPLRLDALLNQCTVEYHRQGGAVQLLLPHYDAAVGRLTAQGRITYDREKGTYQLNEK